MQKEWYLLYYYTDNIDVGIHTEAVTILKF